MTASKSEKPGFVERLKESWPLAFFLGALALAGAMVGIDKQK